MKPFSKPELTVVLVALAGIITLSLFNFRASLRRARDAQRRNDMGYIATQLAEFKAVAGYVPLASDDGRIKACEPDNFKELQNKLLAQEINTTEYLESLRPCDWGYDPLEDLINEVVYIETLSGDPESEQGIVYRYISNARRYQIYSYLEGEEEEDEYNPSIYARGLECGVETCNFGRALEKTPLDISLDEYEQELEMLQK